MIKTKLQVALFKLRHSRLSTVMRTFKWRLLGMKCGRPRGLSRIDATWPHQVEIGSGALIEDRVMFKVDGPWSPVVRIVIGNRVFIGRDVEFNVTERVSLGDDVLVASGCRLIDHDHEMSLGQPIYTQPLVARPIHVGEGAWIGANSVILKGVNIGVGAVVGAGSVVRQDIPAGEIWAGVPAKFIRARDSAARHD